MTVNLLPVNPPQVVVSLSRSNAAPYATAMAVVGDELVRAMVWRPAGIGLGGGPGIPTDVHLAVPEDALASFAVAEARGVYYELDPFVVDGAGLPTHLADQLSLGGDERLVGVLATVGTERALLAVVIPTAVLAAARPPVSVHLCHQRPGLPRDPFERLAAALAVNAGLADPVGMFGDPRVSLHLGREQLATLRSGGHAELVPASSCPPEHMADAPTGPVPGSVGALPHSSPAAAGQRRLELRLAG